MAKLRVYELARELNLESKVLVGKVKDLGIEVSSHQSTLTAAQAAKIKETFNAGQAEAKPKVVVRRRRKKADQADSDQGQSSAAADTAQGLDSETASDAVSDHDSDAVSDTVSPTLEKTPGEPSVRAVRVSKAGASATDDGSQGLESSKALSQQDTTEPSSVSEPAEKAVESTAENAAENAVSVGEVSDSEEESGSRLSKATQALISARSKERKTSDSFEAAKIVRKSTTVRAKSTGDDSANRYNLRSGPSEKIQAPAYSSTPFEDVSSPSYRKGDKRKPTLAEEERARTIAKKEKRAAVTTRDLLSSFEDDATAVPGFRRSKKKTVYTPSGGRRKDLRRRKDLKKTEITTPKASLRVVTMEDTTMTVGELARQLSVKSGDIIKNLMQSGVMANINQPIDEDAITLIAVEYGFEVKSNVKSVDDLLKRNTEKATVAERPPIVTVMGHVDHGKTSILDALREADVAAGEAGGITQHIGAYTVEKNGKKVAFLDTPGHAAFSSMRARGAKVTDIVILVVAGDDGVMPQTIEAIAHAKDAGVPVIVAVNKMDKPGINLDRVFTELAEHGIQSEEWGGEHQFVKVSALKKTGLVELIDAILLQAEMLELKASVDVPARGVIIEANLDRGRGPVATVMVTEGTLRKGDIIVAGQAMGRVRAMADFKGRQVLEAGPSTPVEVIGLTDVPMAGDQVDMVVDDKIAKSVVDKRYETFIKERAATANKASLEDLLARVASAEIPEVAFIVKADTQGSTEAICEALMKIESDKVKSKIVHKGVGGVNSSDVSLAETSGAVVFGFNVRAARGLSDEADNKGVNIKYFSIIYELIDAAKAILAGSLPPVESEVVLGHAEVRDAISVPRIGTIAGSAVLDGKIIRNCMLRLIRDDVVIHTGKIGSLRRFKDDVKEVNTGYECGIGIENYNDLKIGDVIEAYKIEESQATL